MSKRYFSAESAHGSSTSQGFANDTLVLVFESKTARDNYITSGGNITRRAIKASEATKEATNYSLTQNKAIKPDTFSGEYWGITNDITDYADQVAGCIGELTVCHDDNYPRGERFYN